MADRTQGCYQLRLPRLLLCWTVLLGTQVFNAQAYDKYETKITVDNYTTQLNGQDVKALNISCYFDDRIPSVNFMSIERSRSVGATQELIQARLDFENDGSVKRKRLFNDEGGPEFTVMQGSAQQLWLNLVLTNVTAADEGDYRCSLYYSLRNRQDFQAVSAGYSYREEKKQDRSNVMMAASQQKADDSASSSTSSWSWDTNKNPPLRKAVVALIIILSVGILLNGAWELRERCKPEPTSATAPLLKAAADEEEASSPAPGPSGVRAASKAKATSAKAGPSGVATSPKPGPSGVHCSKSWPSPGPIAAESSSSLSTLGSETGMEMKTLPRPVEQPIAGEDDVMSTQL